MLWDGQSYNSGYATAGDIGGMQEEAKAYGVSFDGFYGFPIFKDVSSTLIVTTACGYHVGAIQKKRKPLNSFSKFGILVSEKKKGKSYGRDNKTPIQSKR